MTSAATVFVDMLDDIGGDYGMQSALAYMTTPPPDDDPNGTVDIGYKDLDGEHAGDALLGVRAPSEWWALATITNGWAAPMSDDDLVLAPRGQVATRPSSHPDATRVRSITVVTRNGEIVSRMHSADGTIHTDEPGSGFVLDAMLRVFELPTPPPAIPVQELYISLWLTLVSRAGVTAADARRPPLTWRQAIRLHPAISDSLPTTTTPAALASSVAGALDRLDWPTVRRWARRGSLQSLCEPDLARWMDDGIFARWLLGQMAPLPLLVERAERALAPADRALLREAVEHFEFCTG
jgi:hypothetical protein